MRKLIAATILGVAFTSSAVAQQHRYGNRYEGGGNWAPVLGGMIAGVIIYDAWNRPIYTQPQPPVYVQPPQVYVQPQAPVYVVPPPVVYDCYDVIKPSSVPGNEHLVRTCTPRYQ